MLKFFYNGIKDTDNGGKLQKVFYSMGMGKDPNDGVITIYSREYSRFTKGVQDAFTVQNETDLMTDYFEKDRIRVMPDHPLYKQVKAAHDAAESRRAAKAA